MTPERWQQIARLFDEALELEPDRRADFLAEACAGDDALRREVETLLAARDDAGGFLSRDAIELEAAWLAAERTAIPSGQMIGHFEALEPLGAGAMGEVYLARDTRLERQVALKLLPARFTQDAQRLRRFEREARAASALNHPNIITVYETGVDGAYHFIAAEFVAGVTLRQRLAEGPLPLAEAIAVAAQIAAALDAAHAAGITHRDIKPENVMLRPDGVVKVLDFGIAKLTQLNAPGQDALNRSTEQGTVIGTPGYMSPEQARGLDVDARTDIFSLGVTLYEMVAGHAPFRGATHTDVIVALLEREPEPLSANSPESPVELDEIVAKALAKDVARRYQTVGELLADLQAVESGQGETLRPLAAQPRVSARSLRARWTGLALAAVVLIGLPLAGALAWRYYQGTPEASDWSDRSKLRPSTPYSARMGLGGQLSPPSFAPDGKRIAFSLGADGRSHIVVKELDGGAELKLTDEPVRDYDPIWSPDGARLAFISLHPGRSEIRTLPYPPPPDGAQTLLKALDPSAPAAFLIAWQRHAQGERIYYESEHNLYALDPVSRQVERLTQFDPQHSRASKFSPSPQGERILYLESRDDNYYVMLKPLNGAPEVLLQSAEPARWLSWFPDGRRIAFISNRNGGSQIFVLRLDTRAVEQVTSNNEDHSSVVVAPSGKSLLAMSSRENANIFAWDFSASAEVEYTSEFGLQIRPEPAPDGKMLLFQTVGGLARGKMDIFAKPIAPGSPPLKLVSEALHARWSPDGETVAFVRTVQGKHELWIASARGGAERRLTSAMTPARFLPTPYLAQHADYVWSPDSTKIAYSSKKSGPSNLWVVACDGTIDTSLTNNADRGVTVYSPHWSPDGKRLAYLSSVSSANQPSPTRSVWLNAAGRDELLFQRDTPLQIIGWTASGQKLLVGAGNLKEWTAPQEVELVGLELARRKPTALLKVAAAYLPTLRLARDGRSLVVVTRKQGRDNLELISVSEGTVKRLTNNSDPTIFYTSPAWAADGRSLFYSKQTSWQFLHLLEKQ